MAMAKGSRSSSKSKPEDVPQDLPKPRLERRASSKLRSLPVTDRMLLVLPRVGLATDDQLEHLAQTFPNGGSKAMQALLNLMASGVEDCVTWSRESWKGDTMGSVTGKDSDKLDLSEPIPLPPTAGCTLLHSEGTLEVMLNQLTYSVANIANQTAASSEPLEVLAADAPRQVCVLVQRLRFTHDVDSCMEGKQDLGKLHKLYTETKSKFGTLLLDRNLADAARAAFVELLLLLHEQLQIITKLRAQRGDEDRCSLWQEQMRFYHIPKEEVTEVRTEKKTVPIGHEYSPPSMLVTTDFTHNLRWAYLDAMCEGGKRLLVLVGPTGSGKTAMLHDVGELLGMLPTSLRATTDMPADSGYWTRKFNAANRGNGGKMAPVIITQAQRLSESTLDVALKKATDMEVALCLTMVPGPEAKALQDGLLEGCTVIRMPESDLKVIAAGQLAAAGLEKSDSLAEPLANILESLTKECTKQSHYDFGARTLVQICTQIGVGRGKGVDEGNLVREVMKRCLMPRLVNEDVPKLVRLLAECPQLQPPRAGSKEIFSPSTAKEGRWPTVVENILSITKVEPDCMVLPVPLSDEKMFHEHFCRELNAKNHTMVEMEGKLADMSVAELLGALPKKGETVVKDGKLIEVLRKAMEDHPCDHAGGSGGQMVWVYIMTGQCSPEKWECLFELLNDSGCLNLPTGEQLRLAPNMRFLFVLPDAGDTPADTFSRTAVVWTDPSVAS